MLKHHIFAPSNEKDKITMVIVYVFLICFSRLVFK